MGYGCNRRDFLKRSFAGSAALAFSQLTVSDIAGAQTKKPNFIFFLIDDLGWSDLSCYGSTFYETPNIDRLAARGMKFTNAYAACPVCSPTRASVVTGKYPARLHLTDWITGHVDPTAKLKVPDWTKYLDHSEVTIAEALKPAGYVSASIGKWHLGGEEYWPDKQGFDVNIAGYHAGQPPSYYHPYVRPGSKGNSHIPTMDAGDEKHYLTDRLTDEAISFIEDNKEKPFFVYLAHYAVHTPIQGKEELVEYYQPKSDPDKLQNNPDYAAMIHSVDDSVGKILDSLDRLGLADDTILFFMSDNGGLIGEGMYRHVTSNLPLREGKGTPYEGGIREPMIVSWPETVRPGSVCDEVVISNDFYPTILEMAEISGSPNGEIDGLSLVPLLKQTGHLDREAVFWHYPHYHPLGSTPFGAVRKGDFKLIEFYEDWRCELYNIRLDVGEQQNLVLKYPEKTRELRTLLDNWRKSVGAQMPSPNPDYVPPTPDIH